VPFETVTSVIHSG